jgi:hypothetical protein
MKRSLLAAALLAATATTALAASASNSVVLRTAGYWKAYYDPSNSGGKPMCGMVSMIDYTNGATGSFMVKYAPGGDLFVDVYKTSWAIPKDTAVPIFLQFDRSAPLTVTALGNPAETYSGSFVQWPIKDDFIKSFIDLFANANSMTLGFQQGSEKPWAINMSGSREVAESFRKCVTMLSQGPSQPYGSSSPSQPYGGAQPPQPSQPFGGSKPAPKANDGGI